MLDGPRLDPMAGGRANLLVVLLHGYGSCGEEMLHLARGLQAALPTAAFLAPDAPGEIERLAKGRMWWRLASFDPVELAAGADAAALGLNAFLDHELAICGLPADRLLLVGFSQGMMMALHVGLRRAVAPAAIVGLSGMLVAPERLPTEIRARPPVLLIHGPEDEVVPFRERDLAAEALRATGVPVETKIASGIGHWIGESAPAEIAAFVGQMLASGTTP